MHPPPGRILLPGDKHGVKRLPKGHVSFHVKGVRYYSAGGYFYRARGGRYYHVSAPIGFRISVLPLGFKTLHVGRRTYFHHANTYYMKDGDTYIVTANPQAGTVQTVSAASAITDGELVIYPAEGQSDARRTSDIAACKEWAAKTYSDMAAVRKAEAACLESRGYAVK